METITREKTETITKKWSVYVAIDGTEFEDMDECQKYEMTAEAVIRLRIQDCTIKKKWHSEIDDSDEHFYDTLVPTKQEHIDAINQMWWLYGGRKDKSVPLLTTEDLNKPLLMGYRFEGDWYDWVWFYKIDNLIRKATEDKFQINERNKEGWESYKEA